MFEDGLIGVGVLRPEENESIIPNFTRLLTSSDPTTSHSFLRFLATVDLYSWQQMATFASEEVMQRESLGQSSVKTLQVCT